MRYLRRTKSAVLFIFSFCAGLSAFYLFQNNRKHLTQLTKNEAPLLYPGSDEITLEDWTAATKDIDSQYRSPATANATTSTTLRLPTNFRTGQIFTKISEPTILQELERRGYSLAYHFERENRGVLSNAELLLASPKYASIERILKQDLIDIANDEKNLLSRRDAESVGVGMQFSIRIFDANWFKSRMANYELVGVINRLDRFAFNSSTCGEIRFIYRLGYKQENSDVESRLPMTLQVRYMTPGHSNTTQGWALCKSQMVTRWTYPNVARGSAFVDWLISSAGPLATEFTEMSRLHSIEVNLQAQRVASQMRPNLGGSAIYLMRVLVPDEDRFTPSYLENTPDVNRIRNTPQLLADLKTLLNESDTQRKIDYGTFVLPEKFLAQRALSFSPMGLSRRDNRLFHQLLTESDFPADAFHRNRIYVKNAAAALKRLNDLSCVGCHQGRATAGFHFLGIDRPSTHARNALAFEGSEHFQLEIIRRTDFMQKVANNIRVTTERDFSFAPPPGRRAGQGHFCGLGADSAFSHWSCAAGLECLKIDGAPGDEALGKCFPMIPTAGAPCIAANLTQTNHAVDSLTDIRELSCNKSSGRTDYRCSPISGGFPNGSCYTSCDHIDTTREVCAHIAGPGFTRCMAERRPFESCLNLTATSGRSLCNENISCRNDYVCARHGSTAGSGTCTPSYFLFQIRLDGHPVPSR